MTSIVERLRNPAFLPVKDANMELRLAAADEIERLKAQAVTDWIKHGEEIERLREHVAALQLVATSHEPEIERLQAVRNMADLLVNECEGGRRPPSLGILARLEDALVMEHKARCALEPKP